MRNYSIVLRLLAAVFPVVALLHVALGPSAEALLGANISAATLLEPSLDSQNRFYGAAFVLYGVVFYLCASDLPRFAPMLKAALACFLIGGLARIVSVAVVGWPAPLVIALAASEIALPPVLWLWYEKLTRESDPE